MSRGPGSAQRAEHHAEMLIRRISSLIYLRGPGGRVISAGIDEDFRIKGKVVRCCGQIKIEWRAPTPIHLPEEY